jgi:hypothetical protein
MLATAAAAAAMFAFAASSGATTGVTITVTTTNDPGVPGTCSLRQAVIAANTDTAVGGCPAGNGADTIIVPAGTYGLGIQPQGSDGPASGDLNLTTPVTIKGAGSGVTIVDAGSVTDRLFHITGSGAYTLSGLTIEHGHISGAGGGVAIDDGSSANVTLSHDVVTANAAVPTTNPIEDGGGAGIYNGATLVLSSSTVSHNMSDGDSVTKRGFTTGGGIWNTGTLTVRGSVISANSSGATTCGDEADGGGIYSDGPLTMQGSLVSHNTACGAGGGVEAVGAAGAQLSRDTISGNTADQDGGVLLDTSSSSTLDNSTISGNDATDSDPDGGGVYVANAATMSGDTVSGNNFPTAGGFGAGIAVEGSLTLTDSTVTGNGSISKDTLGAGVAVFGTIALLDDTLAVNLTSASSGEELYLYAGAGGTAQDTIFDGEDQCGGTGLTSLGHNLENVPASSACYANDDPTNLAVGDPKLGPLTGHGGPTQTMALLPGSPALDAGANCASTDQRGAPRNPVENGETVGKACDIGAYERAFCRGVLVDRVGTAGKDTINGGPGNDGILALAGNDTINPGAGEDGICAGAGNDTVSLQDGSADSADGGPGTDTVTNHDADLDTLVRFEVVH